METDDSFITELELLENYHFMRIYENSKARSVKYKKIKLQQQGPGVESRGTTSNVVDELNHIVNNKVFFYGEATTDTEHTDLIQQLVDLLKESGDKLNEKIQMHKELVSFLENSFSYGLFEKLTSEFVCNMVPEGGQTEETTEQKKKIAWTFELTSRLSALDLQPMNRVMGFGAQYVHQHFTPWILQHGGWDNAFNNDDDKKL